MNSFSDRSIKNILILFPSKVLGKILIEKFIPYANRMILFCDDAEIKDFFHSLPDKTQGKIIFIDSESPTPSLYSTLSSQIKNDILNSELLINFWGHYFLNTKTDGDGENWEHKENPNQYRFDLLGQIFRGLQKDYRGLWFNITYGRGGKLSEEPHHCKSRYGLTGQTAIWEMSSKLSHTKIFNICLTYIRNNNQDGSKQTPLIMCQHCFGEKFNQDNGPMNSDEKIAETIEKIFLNS